MSGFWEDAAAYDSKVDDFDGQVSAVVSDLERSPPQTAESDEDFDDADELYLEVLITYRTLLRDSFFNEDTRAVKIVENELRSFIRHRMRVMMGKEQTKQEAAPVPFSPDQVTVLQAVANKLLQRPSQADAKSEPTLKKEVPVAVAAANKAPTLRKAPVAQKPKATPPAAKPVASPVPEQQKRRVRREARVLETKEISESGGRVAVTKTDAKGRIVREYQNANGEVIGTRDITPQVRPVQSIPMPSPHQMTTITHQQAIASVTAGTGNVPMNPPSE